MKLALLLVAIAACAACRSRQPQIVLWAWERPEDLRSIDSSRVAVAVLERTVNITGAKVEVHRRMQPVRTPPGTQFLTVVRVETREPHPAALGQAVHEIFGAVRPGIAALQIDYDAVESERPFYAQLLRQVRGRIRGGVPLSITALASWCMFDDWINALPIDEAVPMLFRTGAQGVKPADFRAPICRDSVGIALDESPSALPAVRRVYVFSPRPWDERTVQQAMTLVGAAR